MSTLTPAHKAQLTQFTDEQLWDELARRRARDWMASLPGDDPIAAMFQDETAEEALADAFNEATERISDEEEFKS